MKILGVLLFSAILVGCDSVPPDMGKVVQPQDGQPAFTVPKRSANLTDAQKIELLRQSAKDHHLDWHIFCVKYTAKDPDEFQGTAWSADQGDVTTTDRWMQTGATQAEAAYNLYTSIQGAPTHPAEKPEHEDLPYICPLPELRSRP
jgi:hypothetical protein